MFKCSYQQMFTQRAARHLSTFLELKWSGTLHNFFGYPLQILSSRVQHMFARHVFLQILLGYIGIAGVALHPSPFLTFSTRIPFFTPSTLINTSLTTFLSSRFPTSDPRRET